MVPCERQRSGLIAIACCLLAALAVGGCANVATQKNPPIATEKPLVLGQLVIHSDFPLPPKHRLLDDLVTLRGDLLAKLDLPGSNEPIDVYLFGNEERFNQFIHARYPTLPPRRAFFLKNEAHLVVYAHWGDRVAEDLRHEVAHGYLHSVVPHIPLWLDEGLAEYFEVPRGMGGLNKPHVELLSAQVQSGNWRADLVRLEQLPDAAQMTQADYAEAWAWTHYMLEGGPGQKKVLHDYLQALRGPGPIEPLSRQLAKTEPGANERLVEYVKRFSAVPQSIAAGSSRIAPITSAVPFEGVRPAAATVQAAPSETLR